MVNTTSSVLKFAFGNRRNELLHGEYARALASEHVEAFILYEESVEHKAAARIGWALTQLHDPDLLAFRFMATRSESMVERRRKAQPKKTNVPRQRANTVQLPTGRRTPCNDPWRYAYLITGEKKIGKTSFAIEGCEELVLQFDKPQLSYAIRETMVENWKHCMQLLKLLEEQAATGKFMYQRIIVDGVGEWYTMLQTAVCKHFGVEHPSDEGYARAWHKMRDDFTSAVNRLLRLQETAGCGIVFIAHAEWSEKSVRGGAKVDKLVPNLPAKCEEIINGKVDGWFVYDYTGEQRVLVTQGDETTGAGHRIDGHFLTADGRRIREINMGNSASEALHNFHAAFANEPACATYKEEKESRKAKTNTNKVLRRRSRKA